MDNLEKYIKDNLDKFEQGEMPTGHKERFFEKLSAMEMNDKPNAKQSSTIVQLFRRKRKRVIWSICSAAAIIIIALFVGRPASEEIKVLDENGVEYTTLMTTLENEIIDLSKSCSKKSAKEALKASRNVTFEAIPITEQLPEELSDEERAKILRRYYKEKTDGLKRIKTYLAEQSTTDETLDE